jgi:Sec-independent protein translocase protein TatA
MGFMDDAKDTAETAGRKLGDAVDDAKDRLGDKADELRADADVRRAGHERAAVHAKNEAKGRLRDES